MPSFRYRCLSCDALHEGLPALMTAEPLAVADIPVPERATRVLLDPEPGLCVIDRQRGFQQALLHLPVHGVDDVLGYGLWVELAPPDFERQLARWADPDRGDGAPLPVTVACHLPGWDRIETTGLLRIRPPGQRPLLEPTGDDPLSVAFREGLSQERAAELAAIGLHPPAPPRRPLAELLAVEDPGWPRMRPHLEAAANGVDILPVDPKVGRATLEALQVSARSGLGALGLETGGLRVAKGWLWILGGGPPSEHLTNLVDANGLHLEPTTAQERGWLIVAYDALGGVFAVNDHGLPAAAGEVCYRAPDTLRWEPLGLGHSAFVEWAATGDLAGFYGPLRTEALVAAAARLPLGKALSIYPFLWTEGPDLGQRTVEAVPMADLFGIVSDFMGA